MISGKDVFARLKFESGVHRVQRVPKTEASGRNARPVASVATKTITDFTALRRDLKIPEPV